MNGAREFNREAIAALAACVVGLALGPAQLIFSTFTLFAQPLGRQFGWGHAQIALLPIVLGLTLALGSAPKGYLFDRIGVREVVLPLTVVLGVTISALAYPGLSRFTILLLFGVIGLLTPGNMPFGKVIGEWFHGRRGIAYAVMNVSLTLSAPVGLQLARWLIDSFGWRTAFAAYGGLDLLVAMPLMYLYLRNPHYSATRTASAGTLSGKSLLESGRTLDYWLILGNVVLVVFAYTGLATNGVDLLAEKGVSRAAAASILSFLMVGALVSQPVLGYLLDRYNSPRVALIFAVFAPIGLYVIDQSHTPVVLTTGVLLLGIGAGGEGGATQYFISRYFGLRHFGLVYGSLQPFIAAVSVGAGLYVLGRLYDQTGSYRLDLRIMEVGLIVAAMLLAFLGPYVFPRR